jgi:hypothetical protein
MGKQAKRLREAARISTWIAVFFIFSCVGRPALSADGAATLKSKLGARFYAAIANPELVRIFKVNPDKKAEGDIRIAGFVVVGPEIDVPGGSAAALSAAFSDPDTYDFTLAKRGLLFPEYGFRFEKSGRSFFVLFDKSRMELGFYEGDKEKMREDCDKIDRLLLGMLEGPGLFQE